MKFCNICGKKQCDDKKNFINIFLNGMTWDNRPGNMMISCVNCAQQFKVNRYESAVKLLISMGMKYNKKGNWVYNNKSVRVDTIDINAYDYQIEFLKTENKELKALLGFKKQ